MSGAVVIASAPADHEDPWHDLRATTGAVAALVAELGMSVAIEDTVNRVLSGLAEARLLVVNISGEPRSQPAGDADLLIEGIRDFVTGGGGLVLLHSSILGFDKERWADLVGARWGSQAMHPPLGQAEIQISGSSHPITRGVGPFSTYDERYCNLDKTVEIEPLLSHSYEDLSQPLLWAREIGVGRVVYSALGHEERGYQGAEYRSVLTNAFEWALATAKSGYPRTVDSRTTRVGSNTTFR